MSVYCVRMQPKHYILLLSFDHFSNAATIQCIVLFMNMHEVAFYNMVCHSTYIYSIIITITELRTLAEHKEAVPASSSRALPL